MLDRPDVAGRKAILEVHTTGKPLESNTDLGNLAKQTAGFSGADLANMVNEAAILSARRNKSTIAFAELEEAIDRVMLGPERKSRLISQKEKEIIAYHEAGHGLVAFKLPSADPVHKISIVARGMAGGYTKQLPSEDRHLYTLRQFKDILATSLGGRVAEETIFSEVSTGAQNDLEHVTSVARKMIKEFGMSQKLGPRTFGRREEMVFLGRMVDDQKDYGDKVADEIDVEIRLVIDEAYQTAKDILGQNQAKLEQIAKSLITEETLEGEELEKLFQSPLPELQETQAT